MELRAYEPADAAVVAGWPASAAETRMWCGLDEVTAATVAGWAAQPDVVAYGLVDAGELIGYGELWPDDEEGEVELARIIVAPGRRGRGVGRFLATALAGRAAAHHATVVLRVHPSNTGALRCYVGAGFTLVPPAEADEWNAGQPVPYEWLRW